jgi:hypothetical protein
MTQNHPSSSPNHPKSSPNHPKSWNRAESKSVHAATRRAMRRIKLSAPVEPLFLVVTAFNGNSGDLMVINNGSINGDFSWFKNGLTMVNNGNIHGIYPLVIEHSYRTYIIY